MQLDARNRLVGRSFAGCAVFRDVYNPTHALESERQSSAWKADWVSGIVTSLFVQYDAVFSDQTSGVIAPPNAPCLPGYLCQDGASMHPRRWLAPLPG